MFQGVKVPGNKSYWERKFQGAKVPRSESSRERLGQSPIGTFAPESKLARERKGSVPPAMAGNCRIAAIAAAFDHNLCNALGVDTDDRLEVGRKGVDTRHSHSIGGDWDKSDRLAPASRILTPCDIH